MTVIKIELIEPRVQALLEELAKLNLIKIQPIEEPQKALTAVISKLRTKEEEAPSLEEITNEVEAVRKERYENII